MILSRNVITVGEQFILLSDSMAAVLYQFYAFLKTKNAKAVFSVTFTIVGVFQLQACSNLPPHYFGGAEV
jgi:hypothetical protein